MTDLYQSFLKHRGYSEAFLSDRVSRTHMLPDNIDTLCHMLNDYRVTKKHLVIVTDFDMDGIMSGVIAFAGLSELGFRVSLFTLDTDAYGFSSDEIDRLVRTYPDVSGIITADVGITCFKGVSRAYDHYGLDVFVTDHHRPKGEIKATCVYDPYLSSGDVNTSVCGAYVIYQILRHFAMYYVGCSSYYLCQIDRLRVFVGIATISDSMPLFYENIGVVKDSLQYINYLYNLVSVNSFTINQYASILDGCDVYKNAFLGLYIFVEVCIHNKVLKSDYDISEDFFGFYLAPIFNSVKRLSKNVLDAFNVFFGSISDKYTYANKLFEYNVERKEQVSTYYDKFDLSSDGHIFITEAGLGIAGLLAQKISDKTGELALVVKKMPDGTYHGSGRCPEYFPFFDLVTEYGSNKFSVAGHKAAFGFFISSDSSIEEVEDFICSHLINYEKPETKESYDFVVCDDVYYNNEVVSDDVDKCLFDMDEFSDFLEETSYLRPFGSGMPEPRGKFVFSLNNVDVITMGKNDEHVKFVVCGIPVVCFNCGDISNLTDRVCVSGRIVVNFFNDITTIQVLGDILPESYN